MSLINPVISISSTRHPSHILFRISQVGWLWFCCVETLRDYCGLRLIAQQILKQPRGRVRVGE